MRTLTICHLYPELMNLYGDRGNVIALARRMEWHGIEPRVEGVSVGESDLGRFDLIFMGGGQDREQKAVCADFRRVKGASLADAALAGV
ncbi:MAG: glutamine amidotransferase, partial [Firmicutes bacterium]|nr:glutamine amidotransferase [Bacillota bacterium]